MGISFECGNCGKPFNVGPEAAGKTGRCKRCGALMTIPRASTSIPVSTWPETSASAVAPATTSRSDLYDSGPLPPRMGPLVGPKSTKADKKKKGWWKSSKAKASGEPSPLAKFGRLFFIAIMVMGMTGRVLKWVQGARGGGNGGGAGGVPAVASPEQASEAIRQVVAKYDGLPIALPRFPEVGPGREIEPGVMFHEIILGPLNGPIGSPPGQGGKLWLYLPSGGDGADRSLPCVLITGAGSNLLCGMALGDGDRAEHLPYVKAGFAVLAFELDGSLDDLQGASEQARGEAMIRFLTARAGLVNAHVALEYVLKKVPAVDPGRISVAGHSSAGVVSVLFAETEPRLKSAVAFAPAVDLEKRFGPGPVAQFRKLGIGDLATRYSPKNNVGNLQCPLFLFQARDDSNTPASDAEAFVEQAKAEGKSVTYDLVDAGGHYESMIREGIPHAIAWLGGRPVARREPRNRSNPRRPGVDAANPTNRDPNIIRGRGPIRGPRPPTTSPFGN